MRTFLTGLGLLAAVLTWGGFPAEPAPLGAALPPLDTPCDDEVLLAEPGLDDPDLGGAVVLLCRVGPGGAVGLVLNRTTGETWRDVAGLSPRGLALAGGPVDRSQPSILYRGDDGALWWTTSALEARFPALGWARPPRIPEHQVVAVLRGYVGWGPGQLDAEIGAGAWRLAAVGGQAVLTLPLDERAAARWAGE